MIYKLGIKNWIYNFPQKQKLILVFIQINLLIDLFSKKNIIKSDMKATTNLSSFATSI